MTTPAGLADSAAATLVRLMIVELAGVDIGYVSRFAALDTTGDRQAVRDLEARLTTDARCLEASVTAWLSEVADVKPRELGPGLEPLSASQVYSRWRALIEERLASGHVRAADLNALLAGYAVPAEDGDKLLVALAELDECRQSLWHNTRRSTIMPDHDLERLRKLDWKRRQVWAQIRARYPIAVRADDVQAALQRQYEAQRAELLAAQAQYTTAEDQAGFAMALEHLDSAHELALRRQSVPQYGDQPPQPPAPPPVPGSLGAAVGEVMQSVLVQMEQQRAQLVSMRDQDLTAAGRAGYDQAIAQIDVNIEAARRHPAPAMDPEPAMTDEERRITEQAIADVAKATAHLTGLGASMHEAAARGTHMLAQVNQISGLSAELGAVAEERWDAQRAVHNAEAAVDAARRSGVRADHQAAIRHHEQVQRRYAALDARVAELEARLQAKQRELGTGLPGDTGAR